MDRRSFLSNTAAVGAGAAALPLIGCGPSLRGGRVGTLDEAGAEAIVAELRRSLDATADVRLASRLVPESRLLEQPSLRERLAHADALAEVGVHALLIADAGGRVRREAPDPERYAASFDDFTPRLDEAVIAHTALIARAPVREKQRVSERLRSDPDLVMRIGEALDEHARSLGVSADGRGKMRRILTDINARSRVQSFGVVADEYVEKVHRVVAQRGQDVAFARALATNAAAAALWAPLQVLGLPPPQTAGATSLRPAGQTTPTTDVERPSNVARPTRPPGQHRGTGLMVGGGITLGIGGTIFGIGMAGALGSGGIGFAFVATLGAVGMLVGLILLLVGAILRATE